MSHGSAEGVVREEWHTVVYAPLKRKLTADEYQHMGEAGIIRPDERVERLDGELYEMPPIGDGHIGKVNRANFVFSQRLAGRAIVSVQNPIRLSPFSEPQPDIAILRLRPDFYETSKARPEDVLLLADVADSSLDYDRRDKLPRYAAAGIIEVWIVNVIDRCIEVDRNPRPDGYATRGVHTRTDILTPIAIPDLAIQVEEILPTRASCGGRHLTGAPATAPVHPVRPAPCRPRTRRWGCRPARRAASRASCPSRCRSCSGH